jgi:hypothetical protein
VLTADVATATGGQPLDIDTFARRPGVIAVSGGTDSLKITLGRQSALVDLATLKLELERMPGVTNVHEVVVAP